MAGGHLLPLSKGALVAEGSPASRPVRLLSVGRDGAGLTLTRGSCGGSQALPNARAVSGGRACGEVTRAPNILRRAKDRKGQPDRRAAGEDSGEVTGTPPPDNQRSVLRYPRVPRIPEVPGLPEVPG